MPPVVKDPFLTDNLFFRSFSRAYNRYSQWLSDRTKITSFDSLFPCGEEIKLSPRWRGFVIMGGRKIIFAQVL